MSAKPIDLDVTLRDVARECLEAASYDTGAATELLIERIQVSESLKQDAIRRAAEQVVYAIEGETRRTTARTVAAVAPIRARPMTQAPQPIRTETPKADPPAAAPPARVVDLKPVAPHSRERSPTYLDQNDKLATFKILQIPIRDCTADDLRRDISMRKSRADSDLKYVKFETELLKLMKPGKTVGRSTTDTDILNLMRLYL